MSQDQNPNNVIQFPGRRKESPDKPVAPQSSKTAAKEDARPRKKQSKKTLLGSALAVILATGAVNRFVFETPVHSMEFTSQVSESAGRGIASVDRRVWHRDAQWEKELAEKLASPKVRVIASESIGRQATMAEKLRWGILEEKYTIVYRTESPGIQSIFLQDTSSEPSYIRDREKFLREFGSLFEVNFAAARLKSVETNPEKTVESYTLYDENERPASEARFELDRFKRLISLKVEPVQI